MSESRWSNVRELCSSFCNANVKNACPSRCVPECPEICQYSFIPSAGNSNGVYKLDPFFIATLVCLAAGLFVACMYTIYLKYYSARGRRRQRPGREVQIVGQGQEHGHSESHSFGLEASIICAIKVHTYMEADGPFKEECAVCLNEFQDGEVLRILPKCDHAFHMTCVDVWLGSNISCPLCRARIVPHIDDVSPTSEDHTIPV